MIRYHPTGWYYITYSNPIRIALFSRNGDTWYGTLTGYETDDRRITHSYMKFIFTTEHEFS